MSNPGLNAIYNGAFAEGLNISNSMGLGRHRRRGNGLITDVLKSGHDFAKKHKLVSKGLSALHGIAESSGYGKKRKGGRRHRR